MKSKCKFKINPNAIWVAKNINTGEIDPFKPMLSRGWKWVNYEAKACSYYDENALLLPVDKNNNVMSGWHNPKNEVDLKTFVLAEIPEDELQLQLVAMMENGALLKSLPKRKGEAFWVELKDGDRIYISRQRADKLHLEHFENLVIETFAHSGLGIIRWKTGFDL